MNILRKFLVWSLMLNKRLLKKASFLFVLCLIPVLVVAMSFFAQQDSGVVRIALGSEDPNDVTASRIISSLEEDAGVLHFQIAETVEDAYAMVKNGEVDGAWIFQENLQEKMEAYATGKRSPFVTVVEREESVSLQLAREKLYGALYADLSYTMYEEFVYTELFTPEEVGEEDLRDAYDSVSRGNRIVVFEKLNIGEITEESNYLTVPLRGMLALVILLCGLAAILYYQKDRAKGVYDWLPAKSHVRPAFGTCVAAVTDGAVVVLFALALSGLFTTLYKEVLAMLFYIPAVVAFCMLLGTISQKADRLGQIIPFIMICALILSPIFFDLKSLRLLQMLLPTYYYLYALNDSAYLLYMAIYSGILFVLNYVVHRVAIDKL